MSALHHGLVYGLKVAAPFALPGPDYDGSPEVIIEEHACPASLIGAVEANHHLQITDEACLIQVSKMGRVLVRRDGRITLDCLTGLPLEWKLTLALGSGLGTYLHMIGRIPLHGMAWVANGKATMVLGRSGTGKSTVAAAMLQCGHKLLSDDVIPTSHIQGRAPVAYPAHRRFKLSPVLLRALEVDTRPLLKVLPGSDKMAWSIPADAFNPEPTPISRCIILLPERSGTTQVALKPLIKLEALRRLKRQVYRPKLVTALGHQNQLFILAHQLATQATVETCQLPDLNLFQSFHHYANALDEKFGS